jgi:hypothetical protein
MYTRDMEVDKLYAALIKEADLLADVEMRNPELERLLRIAADRLVQLELLSFAR